MNTIRQIIPANNKVAKFKDSNGEVYCYKIVGYALVEFTQPDDQDIIPLVLIPDEGRVELLTEFDRNNELVEICHATKEEL